MQEQQSEAVILVHGLWMNGMDLTLMRWRLSDAGYKVYRFSYRSVKNTLAQHAERLKAFVTDVPEPVVHVVAHSLGGLVALSFLDQGFSTGRPGKFVFLGSPVRGSAAAKGLAERGLGKFLLGNVEEALTRSAEREWIGRHPIGTLAGTKAFGIGRIFTDLPKPNDGTVAEEETRLKGAVDHCTVHTSHTGMLIDREVQMQVQSFLQDGEFIA
jgi:pimeloyl-ACP methyl ester carboxylesterase